MRTWRELVDRREEAKEENYIVTKGEIDKSVIEKAMEVERKMKRLRMAKLSKELFDEII
jgi:hypothetical protein